MDARAAMVREIEAEVRLTRDLLGKDRLDPRVIAALGAVPRHAFVAPGQADAAYVNAPLPIGAGQTISQPYIVAVMTDLIAPAPGHTVLEVGTGCGYQAAVLAELVARVQSIEFIPELARAATARLARLGYDNVTVRLGDGREGWPAHAPYDGILVAAAGESVPETLVDQLRPGGRMAIPVGGRHEGQTLLLIEKDTAGIVRERPILPVAFVPLVGASA
jgi:protein-L-isoaspartate(D-aspartate) O-methyltransferase